MRILIIEDDQEAADYLAKALREAGHVADQAEDGEKGFHLASEVDYDVLVVDRMLPERDGLSVISDLRKQGD
ncbi:MAG: response regulator, partial [Pseudomonadota bacterium]